MNAIDRYIEDVLRKTSARRLTKERFASDLRAHMQEHLDEGASENEVLSKMGAPEDVAREFMDNVGVEYGNLFARLLAFVLDINTLFVLSLPFPIVVILASHYLHIGEDYFVFNTATHYLDLSWMGALVIPVAIILGISVTSLYILYFPLLEHRYGKTLGKYLMGLRVLHLEKPAIELGPAFLRRLPLYFDIAFIDSVFAVFTEKRQRAFDLIAKTIVVKDEEMLNHWWNIPLLIFLLIVPSILIGLLIIGVSLVEAGIPSYLCF